MSVSIKISRNNVYEDICVTSHTEVAPIVDDRERYLAEAGTEKAELIHQCITDALTEMDALLRPLLTFTDSNREDTTEDLYDGTSDTTYSLAVTGRKSPGLAAALVKAVHAYVVDSAMDKFYLAVNRSDLAEKHSAKLPSEINVINRLIYTKYNPSYQ